MSISNRSPDRAATEHGSVLIITLVMLTMLTLLMISTMRTSNTDERTAANARDWNIAFQAAEAALRDGEREVLAADRIAGMMGFSDNCSSDGLCLVATDGQPVWALLTDDGWMSGADSGKSVKYGTYTDMAALDDVGAQPRYIIEVMPAPTSGSIVRGRRAGSPGYFYRVTAVGFGRSASSRVMLQAVYRQH